jgi:hypothetical protein
MSSSDYKYRKAWREAYEGALEPKTCPKQQVTDAVQPCPGPKPPLNKSEWQNKALAAAKIDPASWKPSDGFEANRENVKKVYDYYAGLYNENPDLKWAGMAKLAGGTVYGGLEDGLKIQRASGFAKVMPPGDIIGETVKYQARMVERNMILMQKDIFMDLGWQHQAYRERGICEIEAAFKRGDIDETNMQAWRDIASGDPMRVSRGNKALLRREQDNVLQPSYEKLRGGMLGSVRSTMLSRMAESPIPSGKPFSEAVPGGDVTDFSDRWKWIEEDMLQKYEQLTERERSALVNQSLEELAARKFSKGAP